MFDEVDWPRYWRLRDEAETRWGPFHYDPESEFGHIFGKSFGLDDLSSRSFLLLLGEPDTGKSTAVRRYVDAEPSMRRLVLAGDHGSAQDIVHALQAKAPETGEIFVDGLDESPNVRACLDGIDRWRDNAPGDVALRVVTRTSTISSGTVQSLRRTATRNREELSVLQIAPLREEDLTLIANAYGIDEREFRHFITRSCPSNFAARAGTVQRLAKTIKQGEPLPRSRWDLFTQCEREELDSDVLNPSRGNVGDRFTLDERMTILGRAAAATLFGNFNAMWTQGDRSAKGGTLRPGDVSDAGGDANWGDLDGERRALPEDIVRILGDGPTVPLHRDENVDEKKWASRTRQEFLAAFYLHQREIPVQQVIQLTVNGETGRVPSAMHGVVAWLCEMPGEVATAFAKHIVEKDPHLVLSAGLHERPAALSFEAMERLLRLAATSDLTQREVSYYWLQLPGLSGCDPEKVRDVLIPWLSDASHGSPSSDPTLAMIRASNARGLSTALEDIAKDPTADIWSRTRCAQILTEWEDVEACRRIFTSCRGQWESMAAREVAAVCLHLLWPRYIALRDAWEWWRPSPGNPHGFHRDILESHFVEHLSEEEVFDVLRWLPERDDVDDDACDALLKKALPLATTPDRAHLLATALVRFEERIHQGRWSWLNDGTAPFASRLAVAREVVRLQPDRSEHRYLVAGWSHALLGPRDLADLLALAEDHPEDPFLSQAVSDVAFAADPEHLTLLFAFRPRVPWIDERFPHLFGGYDLRSPEVARLRQAHHREITRFQRPPMEENVREKGRDALDRWLKGESRASDRVLWWLNHDSLGYRTSGTQGDFSRWPGWKEETEDFRDSFREATRRHFAREPWESDYLPDLIEFCTHEGIALDDAVLVRWAVPLAKIALRSLHSTRLIDLLKRAYPLSRSRWEDVWLSHYIEQVDQGTFTGIHGSLPVEALRGEFGKRLLDVVDSWPPDPQDQLFVQLTWQGMGSAASVILRQAHASGVDRAVRLLAMAIHLDPTAGWNSVYERWGSTSDEFRALVEHLAEERSPLGSSRLPDWPVRALIDSYRVLNACYPAITDPPLVGGAHFVSHRAQRRDARQAVIQTLRDKGSHEALHAIQELSAEDPGNTEIKDLLPYAHRELTEGTWTPTLPHQLRALLDRPDRRLVRSADDLQAAVLLSLGRWQDHLDKRGFAWMFYDICERPSLKREDRFSSALADWLERDLPHVVAAADAEIQPRPDERHDVTVTPHTRGRQPIRLIVECKYAKNPAAGHALQTQLTDRYLAHSDVTRGVYVLAVHEEPSSRPPGGTDSGPGAWRDYLERQSASNPAVEPFVLDLRLPEKSR